MAGENKGAGRKPLYVLFLATFVDLMGFGILIPIIPTLLTATSSPYYLLPSSLSVSQGYILLGLLTAIYPLMQFFTSPILGQLSDKFGRKKLLAFALAGTAISYAVFAIGIIMHNIPILFVSRAIDGALGGSVAIVQAAVADITDKKNRVKNYGLLGAAFSLGIIAGPFLGGVLSNPALVSWFNASTPFWFSAGISFINVVLVLIFLPETLKIPSKLAIKFGKSLMNIFKAYSHKALRVLYFTTFFYNAGFTFFTTFAAVFLIQRLGYSLSTIGYYFAYIGILGIFSQAIVVRLVANKFNEEKVLRWSLLVTGIILTLYFFITQSWQLLVISVFFSIANSLAGANMTAIVSNTVNNKVQGEVMGITASVRAIANTIPPILAGFIAVWATPETPILIAASVILISALVFVLFYKKMRCGLTC